MIVNPQKIALLAVQLQEFAADGESVRVPIGEYTNRFGERCQFHLVATSDGHDQMAEVDPDQRCITQ